MISASECRGNAGLPEATAATSPVGCAAYNAAMKVDSGGAMSIDAFLDDSGFDTPESRVRARQALEAAGLTNPRKQALAAYKRPAAEAVLARLVRACCPECAALSAASRPRREPVRTTPAACEICLGSNNRRAALACARVLKKQRVRSLLIVGGTPKLHHELRDLMRDGPALEFVDGTLASLSQKEADHHLKRAQFVVIWASTPLRHAVSNLYGDEHLPEGVRSITVNRRGIEALCREILHSYRYKPPTV
jgi:hypothetical protein